MNKLIKLFAVTFSLLATLPQIAFADYVGELETTKYFDAATLALIQSRGTGGLQSGDQISYIIQFTPTNNGGDIGGGAFVTDYIPAGTKVVNAQFISLNSDGTFTQIGPPQPAEVTPAFMPLYSDTGIFYSTDTRTAMYTTPTSTTLTQQNGYTLSSPGCTGISLPSSTHNAWDNSMVTTFANVPTVPGGSINGSTCTAPAISTYNNTKIGSQNNTGGLSPVAGPDTYLTKDYSGAVGPWQRIAYSGSMKATGTGVTGLTSGGCVGGTLDAAGWALSSANPLPATTNAVRFAAGKVSVGELFTARITLQLTANMPVGGIINNTEVFGGDASMDPGNAAGFPSMWVHWRYFCPAVAVSNSNLFVDKTLVGTCTGSGCTPTPVTAGVVPNAANLKMRYQIQYWNTSTTAQSNVVLTDAMASGGLYVASSYVQVSGTSIGAPTGTTTLTFPTITSLPANTGGILQYDVNHATAPSNNTALINTAKLVSTQYPSGVSSRAIATVENVANLWIGKTVSPSTVASGGSNTKVTYTISIPNNGGGGVTASATTPITVNDYLPTDGLSTNATDRFSYVGLSVVATSYTSAGVATPLTAAPTDTLPSTAAASELVSFKITSGNIPVGGKLVITFQALVGTNVPASGTPYTNSANVFYAGGTGGAASNSSMSETINVAPVTVTSILSLTKKVNCVYTPSTSTTCIPYANGAIATGSKIKYELDYSNISTTIGLSNVVLTDTLPTGTSYVAGTAKNGSTLITPTGTTTLTFPAIASLASSASGSITFDVDASTIASGTNITNVANMSATGYSAGIQASVTSSLLDQVLVISKSTSPTPFSVQPGGSVTYTVTVTNASSTATASAIQLYDELPYDSNVTTANAASEFTYGAAGTFTAAGSPSTIVAVTPTHQAPPTCPCYPSSGLANEQEVYWNFGTIPSLAPNKSFSFTYTVTVGSAMPPSSTPYTSVLQAYYMSTTSLLQMTSSAYGQAPVTIISLDHYELTVPANSINCLPTTVTVTACSNNSNPCNSVATGVTGTVTLATSGGTIGTASLTSGIGTASLSYPGAADAKAVTVSYSSATTSPPNASTCTGGSCVTTFNTAGFIFTNAIGGNTCVNTPSACISNQVAGTTSGTYYLRAVKTIDNTSNTCGAAFTGTKSVNLAYECNNPTSCYSAANLMSVNGGTATTIQRNNNGSVSSYIPVSMTFDANGNAPFTFNYNDVGQVKLWASATVNSASLSGSTNGFVVKPAGFVLSGIQRTAAPILLNPAATTTTGTKFVKAGEQFTATVTAVTSTGSTAYNFGNESTLESVTLAPAQVTGLTLTDIPAIASTVGFGPLTGGVSTFSNGVSIGTDFSWPEVGIITLTPSLKSPNNYLGVAGSVTGTASGNVGRFYAASLGVSAGSISNRSEITCSSNCDTFTYMGEQMSAVFTLTALALDGSTRLQNYVSGSFAQLVPTTANFNFGAIDTATPRTPLTSRISTTGLSAVTGQFSSTCIPSSTCGTAVVTAPLMITRLASADGPYSSLNVGIAPQDADGATVAFTLDMTNVISTTNDHFSLPSTAVRYGQLKLVSSYGSELLSLSMPVYAQYWNGTTYVNNTLDNETSFASTGTGVIFGNYLTSTLTAANYPNSGATAVTPASVVFINGASSLTLKKPGAGNVGSVDLSSTILTYLPTNNAGRATFGVYKGNPSVIYMRENY